jgi:hypothetical protein
MIDGIIFLRKHEPSAKSKKSMQNPKNLAVVPPQEPVVVAMFSYAQVFITLWYALAMADIFVRTRHSNPPSSSSLPPFEVASASSGPPDLAFFVVYWRL